MARTRLSTRPAPAGRRAAAGRNRGANAAPADRKHKDAVQDAPADWEDAGEELDVIPDIDGLLSRPAANRGNDSEARRRIEMLREDRLLQQALSDVFDL
jgi:hypothetical protein